MESCRDQYPSFSIGPLFNLDQSAFTSPYHDLLYHDLCFNNAFYPAWPYPPKRQSLTAMRLPAEIYSETFLYTVQADPHSRTKLMHVCRHWHDIMVSTPGIHSQLRIDRKTMKEDVERLGKRWFLDVTFDTRPKTSNPFGDSTMINNPSDDPYFNPVGFRACFMAAAEAASRWRSLAILSLLPGEYKDLQIMHPLQHLESFRLATGCDLCSFLKPLLKAITTTVTPRFTVMEVFHPDAALYLLKPAHFQIFSSLTTLRLICRRTQNPVDILPSLHKLEIFEAHHLFLPILPSGVDLPLTQTLRVLHLKAVSVQWMEGQIFPALEECSIIFPHHADTIQSVYMPSCSVLKYDSNNLGAVEHFHISHPDKLEIKCGQCNTRRGTLQLAALHPIFLVRSLTCLHLEIKCSERLLVYMLRLVPALEELWMRLSSPHSLSSAFFLAFAAGAPNAGAGSPSQKIAPLGRKLRALHLHYKRWLRGPERNALIRAFGAVAAPHPSKEQDFSFRFSFGEGLESQEWIIREPAERFDFGDPKTTVIGVSSPDGIVPLSRSDMDGFNSLTESRYLPLPRESEYITTDFLLRHPIDFLFSFYSLKEVKMTNLHLKMKPDTHYSLDAPLFHSLRVLIVFQVSSSFFAGQTFHKLERYEEGITYFTDWFHPWLIPEYGPLTEMPVCTRLAVRLSTLCTLKLPQIRELCVNNTGEGGHIWEKRIAVNANLSGLKLLHVPHLWELRFNTFAKILALLPALESLIVGVEYRRSSFVDCLEAFVPMNMLGTSGPNQSSWEGQISGVLCPRLESLQIEGISLTERTELMPVLKDIVTLRAAIGFPLRSLTFYFQGSQREGQKWELIGGDKRFMMEEVVPAEKFRLDIRSE